MNRLAIIQRALEAGINFIDTANVYNRGESERMVGKALKESGKRQQVVLATKVYGQMGDLPNESGASRYHIIQSCEDSLRRLQTDHIDLYQLHRPSQTIPQDETLRAFDDLVRAGKVRYIGCSTHPAWMVMEALATSERDGLVRYISEQPPYNLLDRRIENELVPAVPEIWAGDPALVAAGGGYPGGQVFRGQATRRTRALHAAGKDVHRPDLGQRERGGGCPGEDGAGTRPDRLTVGAAVGEGSARHHRADYRAAHFAAAGRCPGDHGKEAGRGGPAAVRRAGAPGERGGRFPQQQRLDEALK